MVQVVAWLSLPRKSTEIRRVKFLPPEGAPSNVRLVLAEVRILLVFTVTPGKVKLKPLKMMLDYLTRFNATRSKPTMLPLQ